jgi:hypothetical protein
MLGIQNLEILSTPQSLPRLFLLAGLLPSSPHLLLPQWQSLLLSTSRTTFFAFHGVSHCISMQSCIKNKYFADG